MNFPRMVKVHNNCTSYKLTRKPEMMTNSATNYLIILVELTPTKYLKMFELDRGQRKGKLNLQK